MRSVLLIAGAGTLGTPAYHELIRRGYAVDVISLEDYASVNRRLSFVKARADLAYLTRFLDGKRYAAIVDFIHTREIDDLKKRMDLLLSHTDQFVYLSSYRTYADSAAVITEGSPQWLEHPANDRMLAEDDYAIPKAQGERYLTAQPQRNWTIIRPLISFSHFRLDLVTVGAYALLYRTKAGKRILLPEGCRDKLAGVGWAGNVGRQIAHLIDTRDALGEAFTLGTPEEITWGDVASYYEEFLGASFAWVPTEDYLAFATSNDYMDRQMIWCDRNLSRRVDLSKVLRVTGLDPKTFLSCRAAVAHELTVLSERPDLVARFDTPRARAIDARTDAYFARGAR